MSLRPTMLPLIEWIRDLIGDPVDGNELLQAEQIQQKLDLHRRDVYRVRLEEAPILSNDAAANTAQIIYLDYYAPCSLQGWAWEQDEIEQDGYWVQLTPVKFEPLVGHWVFSYLPTPGVLVPKAQSPGQLPPVMVSGKVYDLNAAAYECCRLLLGKLARCTYTITMDGQTLNRYQIMQNVKDVMAECARNIKPRAIRVTRADAGRGGAW